MEFDKSFFGNLNMEYCKCYKPLTLRVAVKGLVGEIREFREEPSLDEFADILRCVNRLAGALFKKSEITIFPYPKIHLDKVHNRMAKNGCIRSERHLINGKCPSEVDSGIS